ncbi:MAG: cation:proton antiporter, partial [Paramuribaculum sp.]|nr:cation:proton antiporter [Paramuribaculum sp.]
MVITPGNIMFVVAILLFLSVWCGKAGSKYGLPSLLIFLGIGMAAGTDGFGLQFDDAATAEFIGMLSLSIILFSGGLDTDFKKIKPVLAPGLVLAIVGVFITTLLTGAFIHEMMRLLLPDYCLGWTESMLLAAIMSSTDSASVFSILNSSGTGLKQRLKPTLELESGSNDPMAYLLVTLLISIIETGSKMSGQLM